MIEVDVRVATSAVCMVMNAFARTSLPSTSRDMLCTNLVLSLTECTAFKRCSWLIDNCKASTIVANVGISASSISAVDLGATCTCKNAHFVWLN